MKKIALSLIISCLLCVSATAAANKPLDKPILHVIYITLDGTRWQNVFEDRSHFSKLWKKYARKGIFYGEPGSHTVMEVASVPVSMPSYQSQMCGRVTGCVGNDCGRIQEQTFPEHLLQQLSQPEQSVPRLFVREPV